MTLSPDDWEVIRLSLKVAIVGVVMTLPVAFGLAYLLARGRFPGRQNRRRPSGGYGRIGRAEE